MSCIRLLVPVSCLVIPLAAVAKGPDRIPPAPVTDLSVAAAPYGGAALTWTAVGDDGGGPGQCSGAGKASAYDIRYSTAAPGPDLGAWFSAATQATGEPAPKACGSLESHCAAGLAPGATYYLAVQVSDERGNRSAISNVVAAATGSSPGAMHIDSVVSSWFYGIKKQGHAFVTVLDEFGQPVPCATVSVEWSGCYPDTASGVTDHTGVARVVSSRGAQCQGSNCCFFVTVTDVTHAGYAYDLAANVTTTGKANCNLLAPSVCPDSEGSECQADCDGSGGLDTFDFLCFQNLFAAGDPGADCDASGDLDFFDFLCFQSAFAAGCP